MKKLILSAAIVAALAGAGATYAASPPADGPVAHHEMDRGFLLDAKLAGVKAALKLTPDQEKQWPAFETAVRDAEKARMEGRQEWREERESGERPSPIAMMTEMSEHLAKMSDELKKVADAAKPLYDSLDDGQKAHFGPLLHMLREGGPHHGGGEHDHGPTGEPKPL